MTGSLPPLPRLAFGNAAAAVSRDLDAFTAMQRSVMPAVSRYENSLRMLGIDDTLYRIVAVMLAPQALAPVFARNDTSPSAAAISRVTDYILRHLDQPITLSDLERVSGLSARTLQVAFQKAYTCSPREWMRRRRLLMARDRLLQAAPGDTVAAIALASGFTRPSSFAAAYAQRFGESPSATLAHARRG